MSLSLSESLKRSLEKEDKIKEETVNNGLDTLIAVTSHNFSDSIAKVSITDRLTKEFYNSPCASLAKSLLGKTLCRKINDIDVLKCKIVETESYLGTCDGASHSFKGETKRNKAMFMEPGTAYVYKIYGMYRCFNISSEGTGAAVLIRPLEPLEGSEIMETNRSSKRKAGAKRLKLQDLCNGPSKLCQALQIDMNINQIDLSTSPHVWLEAGIDIKPSCIVNTTRIGIEGCGEQWSKLNLRWYVLGNNHVSVRNKIVEKALEGNL